MQSPTRSMGSSYSKDLKTVMLFRKGFLKERWKSKSQGEWSALVCPFHWVVVRYQGGYLGESWSSTFWFQPVWGYLLVGSIQLTSSTCWGFNICCVLCLVTQSCLTLWDPMDCSPRGSSVHVDSPGKNTGVSCHAFLQGIFPTQGSNPGLPHRSRILYRLSH